MEIEFIEEKENKLFNRKEIKFYVDYDGEATPKVLDIKSKLIALLNTKKELIVVDNVQPHYGEPRALGYAKVYDTVDDLTYIETEHVIAKNAEPEEEPAEEEAETETKSLEKTKFVLVVVKAYSWLTTVTESLAVNADTPK